MGKEGQLRRSHKKGTRMGDADDLDWEKAIAHLNGTREAYASLVDMPGVNPWFGLGVITAAESRLDKGERTAELHAEIMELE